MENFVVVLILILILGGAGGYVYKAKKRGVKCIGCPAGGSCGHKTETGSGCVCDSGCNRNCSSKCSGNCNCSKKEEL